MGTNEVAEPDGAAMDDKVVADARADPESEAEPEPELPILANDPE
jgi:hypothetical protein